MINRRGFLGALAAIPAAIVSAPSVAAIQPHICKVMTGFIVEPVDWREVYPSTGRFKKFDAIVTTQPFTIDPTEWDAGDIRGDGRGEWT